MARYSRISAVVDAIQFDPDPHHPRDSLPPGVDYCGSDDNRVALYSTIARGRRVPVAPGDWIVTDQLGGREVWKPDAFAATYEPITETP